MVPRPVFALIKDSMTQCMMRGIPPLLRLVLPSDVMFCFMMSSYARNMTAAV